MFDRTHKMALLARAIFANANQVATTCSVGSNAGHVRQPGCDSVEILAITPFHADQVLLKRLIAGTSWKLGISPDFETAAARLQMHSAPVVLCDRDLVGFDWHYTMEILTSIAQASAVILLSSVVDEYLWEEVIRRGGFDVIAKPFRQREVIETIKFALFYRR